MNDLLYIISFLISVIMVDWVGGKKSTFYYLLLVLFGVLVVNSNRYRITFTRPQMLDVNNSSGLPKFNMDGGKYFDTDGSSRT